jgi:hypothetical protein
MRQIFMQGLVAIVDIHAGDVLDDSKLDAAGRLRGDVNGDSTADLAIDLSGNLALGTSHFTAASGWCDRSETIARTV